MRPARGGAGWNRRATDEQLLAAYAECGTILGACRRCGVLSVERMRKLLVRSGTSACTGSAAEPAPDQRTEPATGN